MAEDFSSLAPIRLIARELRGAASRGMSAPLFVEAKSSDGSRVNVVLKLRNPATADPRPWHLCLVRDLVGTILARRLGLNTPDYALVDVDELFIRATARHPAAGRLSANRGVNFGSVRLDAAEEGVAGAVDDWAPVLVFDALGFNVDRKAANPNALWDGNRLYLIDAGMMAPTWTFAVDGTTNTTLYGAMNTRLHASFSLLQGTGATYDEVADAWRSRVTSEFLAWLRQQVPNHWAAPGELDELFSFLGARAGIAIAQCVELTGEVK